MAGKFTKFLVFTAVTAATAAGIYYCMQKKNACKKQTNNYDEDELDDFDEDLDAEPCKSRSYVSLNINNVESIASEAFQRAKEKITDSYYQVKDTVKAGFEGATGGMREFVDLTRNEAEEAADNLAEDIKNGVGDLGKDAVKFTGEVKDSADEALDNAKDALDKAEDAVTDTIKEGVTKVENFFSEEE